MSNAYQMYINGEWVDALSGVVFDDYSPYSGTVFARVAGGGRADVKRAVDAAVGAFPSWSAVPPSEKRLLLLKAADILEKRQKEYAETLADETGAAMPFARFQTHLGPEFLREAASQVHRVAGKTIPSELSGAFNMVLRQPVGVVGAISPWNAPLILSLRAIVFPLAYGNTVVLKPSSESPISGGVYIMQVLEAAGFPKGVVNLVINGPGLSNEVGDEFVTDYRVRRITFTGSTEVGRKLAEQAGRYLKKVTMELGGNDPLLILKDADIDYAVEAAVFGRFMHQGQVCMNSKRIIVEEQILETFTQKFVRKVSSLKVGDPRRDDTVIGPLINNNQLTTLKKQVEKAVSEGAKLLCGGSHDGLCYQPSVLAGVTPNMAIFHEEAFGPVALVISAEDAEHALRMANDSHYGLSSGIITNDFQKGFDLAERLESGVCHINDSSLHDEAHAPLGGMKDSGWGRNGMEAVDEFTELRWVSFQKTKRRFPI